MKKEKFVQNLKEIKVSLRKFCHHPNCQEICCCPVEHTECRKNLGLHTAIAWLMADYICSYEAKLINKKILIDRIDSFRRLIGTHSSSFKKGCTGKLRKILDNLTILRSWLTWVKK